MSELCDPEWEYPAVDTKTPKFKIAMKKQGTNLEKLFAEYTEKMFLKDCKPNDHPDKAKRLAQIHERHRQDLWKMLMEKYDAITREDMKAEGLLKKFGGINSPRQPSGEIVVASEGMGEDDEGELAAIMENQRRMTQKMQEEAQRMVTDELKSEMKKIEIEQKRKENEEKMKIRAAEIAEELRARNEDAMKVQEEKKQLRIRIAKETQAKKDVLAKARKEASALKLAKVAETKRQQAVQRAIEAEEHNQKVAAYTEYRIAKQEEQDLHMQEVMVRAMEKDDQIKERQLEKKEIWAEKAIIRQEILEEKVLKGKECKAADESYRQHRWSRTLEREAGAHAREAELKALWSEALAQRGAEKTADRQQKVAKIKKLKWDAMEGTRKKFSEGDRSSDALAFKQAMYAKTAEELKLKTQIKQKLVQLHRAEIKAQAEYDRELKCAAMRRQEWQSKRYEDAQKEMDKKRTQMLLDSHKKLSDLKKTVKSLAEARSPGQRKAILAKLGVTLPDEKNDAEDD